MTIMLQSMYVLFGTKWPKLFCGPLWSVESTEQCSSSAQVALDPLTVSVHALAMTILSIVLCLPCTPT